MFCAAFVKLYQMNFDLETFIEIKKSAGVATHSELHIAFHEIEENIT